MWPLSRRSRPKQLLHIISGKSLLRHAFERLRAIFPPTDIFVVALTEHLPAMGEELPELPPENLIGEPTGRDTANAIALTAALLHARRDGPTMGVFTADHLIRPTDRFADIVRRGFETAERDAEALVTFGITPTGPETGYGYIERGAARDGGVWEVRAFREKPDADTAKAYLASGRYSWNSGMFVWRTGTILEQLRQHLPGTHAAVLRLAAAWDREDGRRLAADVYPTLERISIDFAVMERAPNVLVVEMPLEWLDVGSWPALAEALGPDADGNAIATAHAASMDSHRNILVSEGDHLIAAIGVEDLVVIHSPDATLVCRRDQAQRIKELVAQLGAAHGERYS